MADSSINVNLPALESSQSAEIINFTKQTVASGDTITIKNALDNKNNSLIIIAELASSATSAGSLKIKAGNNYPNSMLGDLTVTVGLGANAIILEDISRFENRDGSIKIAATYGGTIYAVAKRAGLKPVSA